MATALPLLTKDVLRFWSKVDDLGPDECWPWKYGKDVDGYPLFKAGGVMGRAHRVSYFLAHPEWDWTLCVCHTCDNPSCVNPAHLWLGTNLENTLDKQRKGRCPTGANHHWNTKPECRPRGPRKSTVNFKRGADNVATKITEEGAREIKRALAAGATQTSLARKFGVTQAAIWYIKNGTTWKHVAA